MQTFNSFNDILLTVQTSGKCVSTNRDFTEVADDFRFVWRERHDAFFCFKMILWIKCYCKLIIPLFLVAGDG